MDYNTTRSSLVIPEYGRNIHKMIAYAISVADREERNHVARSIVKVMGQVKPQFKEADDFIQSLWDHMIIISDFKLDVDSPYPYPDREELVKPPNKVAYPQNRIRFRHYGKSIESFIAKASKMEEGPTNGTTCIFFSCANFTILAPGSAMAGTPASESKPTLKPCSQTSKYFRVSNSSAYLSNSIKFKEGCDFLGVIFLINLLADFSFSTIK